jgi:serine/threonine-protein kinase HipA
MATRNEREPIELTVEIGGDEVLVGTLRIYDRRGQSMTFQYAESYIGDPRAYQIDPELSLDFGIFQPAVGRDVFGVFSDSAPDRWGQNLMRRAERNRAKAENRQPRTLGPADFLLGTRDVLRHGAIRLCRSGTEEHIANDKNGVPALIDLARLLNAADAFVEGEPQDQDIKDLLNAGGSLGGARPKAAVTLSDNSLAIAKFPNKKNDNWDIALWERVESELAHRSGIDMAESWLHKIANRNVLIAKRFDREGDRRVGFMSAMTMLGAQDGDTRSYVEIAGAIEVNSSTVERDLEELFRRVIFSVLTNNTDDHLRNHGFLRRGNAWQLSPAYDMNPNPESSETRATDVDPDGLNASIEAMSSVAGIFRLSSDSTKEIVREVEIATRDWRQLASQFGADRQEVDLMEVAFESEERKAARSYGSV